MESHEIEDRELGTVVEKALRASTEPLTVEALRRGLIGPYRRSLDELRAVVSGLAQSGRAHRWPPKSRSKKARYWSRSIEDFGADQIIEALEDGRLSRARLVEPKILGRKLFGITSNQCKRLFARLISPLLASDRVFKVPSVSGTGAKYAVRAPDPRPYLSAALGEFEKVCQKLGKSGVPREHVARALAEAVGVGDLPQPPSALSEAGGLGDEVVRMMIEINPRAATGALVSLRELRSRMGLAKEPFDEAVLAMADVGRIELHPHTLPGSLSEEDRSYLVDDRRGGLFVGAALLQG